MRDKIEKLAYQLSKEDAISAYELDDIAEAIHNAGMLKKIKQAPHYVKNWSAKTLAKWNEKLHSKVDAHLDKRYPSVTLPDGTKTWTKDFSKKK